jgi:hypothetical protein
LRFEVQAAHRSPGASLSGFIPGIGTGLAPLKAGGEEDLVETFGLGLRDGPIRARPSR